MGLVAANSFAVGFLGVFNICCLDGDLLSCTVIGFDGGRGGAASRRSTSLRKEPTWLIDAPCGSHAKLSSPTFPSNGTHAFCAATRGLIASDLEKRKSREMLTMPWKCMATKFKRE